MQIQKKSFGRREEVWKSPAGQPSSPARVPQEQIAKRAYHKFVARGGAHGSDKQDWLEAEKELQREARNS